MNSLNSIVFSPASITVEDGSSATTTWTVPTTTVDDAANLLQACGPVTFALYADDSDTPLTTNWAVISDPMSGTYTLTADTSLDLALIANEAEIDIPLWIKATLTNYPAVIKRDSITVKITEITCSCVHLLWDDPASIPTVTVLVDTP